MKPRAKVKRSKESKIVRRGKPAKSRRKSAPVEARYEAASQTFFDRSWIPAAVQDARFDLDSFTRLEMVRRARYWERNNAIVNRLADVFEQYTVGANGLQVIPNGEDEDWNQAASKWWADWSKWPDVASGLGLGVIQSVMARTWFVDGEVFIYKTFSSESGRPRIQLIEGHRIGTPPEMRTQEGRGIIDGIEFATDSGGQPVGKPKRYWLRTDSISFYSGQWSNSTGQTWEPIDGDRVIHLFEPTRPGMTHGPTFLYPVMNDLHDLDDLQFLEMKAAKSNADVANVVTNKTGEANVTASRRAKWNIQSQDKDGNPVNKQAPLFYETTLGGRTIYVSNGEKFEQFKSDRPAVATKEYWDYLVRKICAGVGISSLLVLPFSLQGTVTRADMDVAASFFRSRSGVLAGVLREIYMWAMSWAVKYDRSLDGAPREWWHCVIRPPRSVTVDIGRNSQAVLEELEGGVRNYQDVCAEMGHDWRHVLRQKAVEAAYINSLVDEFGVTREQIAQLAKQTMSVKEVITPTAAEEATRDPNAPTPQEKELTAAAAPTARTWNVVRDDDGKIMRYEVA